MNGECNPEHDAMVEFIAGHPEILGLGREIYLAYFECYLKTRGGYKRPDIVLVGRDREGGKKRKFFVQEDHFYVGEYKNQGSTEQRIVARRALREYGGLFHSYYSSQISLFYAHGGEFEVSFEKTRLRGGGDLELKVRRVKVVGFPMIEWIE